MQEFSNAQWKLATAIAHDIEHSGCNVGEALQILAEHTGALIGRYAPNEVEIARYCTAMAGAVEASARCYHSQSDIHPQNKSK